MIFTLYENNTGAIERDHLYSLLGFKITDVILPSLFECNILEETSSGGECHIGFYFQKLRDYIFAFKTKKWHLSTTNDFKKDVSKLHLSDVQLDALKFFYQFADIDKKRVLDEPVRVNAKAYLTLYENVLNMHFYNLKHRFSPQSNDPIGFIGTIDLKEKALQSYGFRAITEQDEKIKFVPIDGNYRTARNNILYLLGVQEEHYYSSCHGFQKLNLTKEIVDHEIFIQLEKIIKGRRLNESNNYYLSLEKALELIISKQSELHGIKDTSRLSQYLPIDIERVEYGLRLEKAKYYFQDKLLEKKKESGEIKPIRRGSTSSYSYTLKAEDWQWIQMHADNAALNKTELKRSARNISLEVMEGALIEALTVIKRRGRYITETIFPDEDQFAATGWEYDCFTENTKKVLVHRLFTMFLNEYKTLVETNFPTLKECFDLYVQMPVHWFLIVEDSAVTIYECANDISTENTVAVCDSREIQFEEDDLHFQYQHKTYAARSRAWRSLHLLSSPQSALRNLVYREIERGLPKVMEKLRQNYGIESN